jgi:hypothetical protein
MTPVRICDTRAHNPSNLAGAAAQCNGEGIPDQGTRAINVTGAFGVPADASGVLLNVTVVNPPVGGYLTVFPTGAYRPLASSLNYGAGAAVSNLVQVGTGTADQVSMYASSATDVVVDLEGYTAPSASGGTGAGLYNPLPSPVRLCDTRAGDPSHLSTPDNQCNGVLDRGETLGVNGTIPIQVGGDNGVPPGASAAVLNVTVVNPTAAGFLTVYPGGVAQPYTASVNYGAHQVIGNRVIVPLSTGEAQGQIAVFSSASADVVVDVSGYFTGAGGSGADFTSVGPAQRICDSRAGNPSTLSGPFFQCVGKAIGPAGTLTVNVAGLIGIPTTATAVVVNLTTVGATANTFLTVFPGPARPFSADLNPAAGDVRGNLTVATMGADGTISIFNDSGSVDVVVDVVGWYS